MRLPGASVLWVAGLAFVAGGLAIVDAGGRRAEGTFAPGSVYSETPEGLSLAFRYLQERPPAGEAEVAVLSRRVGAGTLPANGTLIRMRPQLQPFATPVEESEDDSSEGDAPEEEPPAGSPTPLLTPTEEEWVHGGGRLVLGLDAHYGPLEVAPNPRGGPVRKVFPVWPGVVALDPGEIARSVSGGPSEQAHAVFARGSSALLSRLVVGGGEVVFLTVPELLQNDRLATADHLALLEALAGEGRPVVFDEWAHGLGQDQSLLALMFEWGLGPALVVAVVAFALLLWRSRTRIGLEEDDAVEERSEAVDLVESLAQLYHRALTRREAVTLHLQGFRQAVALRTGLKGAALERRTLELLGDAAEVPTGEREIPASAFLSTLHAVNDGYRRLDEHAHTRRRP